MTKEIKDFCKRYGLTEGQFYGSEKYNGSLYLRGLTSIPDTFNPTVGGSLYLRGLTSIPDTFNPTVGGDLYLSGLTSNHTPLNNRLLSWKDGKYVSADGIFTEVISKKGRVYTVKNIGSDKHYYLVTDGKTHAHGDTIEQAKADFRFKVIAAKFKNEPIKPDTVITIPYYRAITGACEFGVKSWMDNTFTATEKADILKNGITAEKLFPILKLKQAYGFEKFESLVAF